MIFKIEKRFSLSFQEVSAQKRGSDLHGKSFENTWTVSKKSACSYVYALTAGHPKQGFLVKPYFASLSICANSRIVSVNIFASMTSERRARNLEIY